MRPLLHFVLTILGLFAILSLSAQSENSTFQTLSTAEKIESPQSLEDNTFYYLFSVHSKHKTLETLIEYIEDLKRAEYYVVASCESENMIYIKTNEKFKDQIDLFRIIEKKFWDFDAICRLEMNERSIAKFNDCNNEKIRIKLSN